jgi:hypothetical protein
MEPDAAQREAEAIAEALAPRGCQRCGGIYGNAAAYVVHFEQGEGSRCLPGDARGQLVEVDGVRVQRGTDAARR